MKNDGELGKELTEHVIQEKGGEWYFGDDSFIYRFRQHATDEIEQCQMVLVNVRC